MASVYVTVDSALQELKRQCEIEESKHFRLDNPSGWPKFRPELASVGEIISSLRHHLQSFEENFRFVKTFLGCIHEWSDADKFVQNLGSLVVKIEATIDEIRDQLVENISLQVSAPLTLTTLFPPMRRKIEIECLEERASKLGLCFLDWKKKIELLKPEIREGYDSLSSHPFQSCFHMFDYGQKDKFCKSIELNLEFLQEHSSLHGYNLIEGFKVKLKLVTAFVDRLQDVTCENPKFEDVLNHVGSVAIRTALVSCWWWASYMDQNMEEDLTITLSDLRQKIEFTNPEFVDLLLRLLRTFKATKDNRIAYQVNIFVKNLLPFPDYLLNGANVYKLHGELISLMESFISIPEDYAENVQRFLAGVKIMLTEVASPDAYVGYEVLNLFAKIWLIKIEIVLREQLTAVDICLEEQINALNRGLRYLDLEQRLRDMKRLVRESPKGSIEYAKQTIILMEEVATVLASLDYSFYVKEITREVVRNVIFKLLLKIMLFQAESLFMKLYDNNESLMVFGKDGIEPIREGLKFLIMFIKNQPEGNVEAGKHVFARIEVVAGGVISLYSSFPTKNITADMINNMNVLLSDLINEMELIMLELKDVYLHVPKNFPRTNGLGFIDYLLKYFRELLNQKADLIASVKHQIQMISGDLEFFRDILEQDTNIPELKHLSTQVVDLAYEAEYLIDSIVGAKEAEWHNSLWLYHLLKDIGLFKKQATEILEKKTYNVGVHNAPLTLRPMLSKVITRRTDEVMVGLSDQEEVIIDRLIAGFLERDIVSIVGMPGIGKTTLARKVYDSPKVVYHFHIRSWCCVSDDYRKRDLLLDILSHITALTDDILRMTNDDLDLKLYQLLKQKRYLIVMDDMWETSAWDDLRRLFPNDRNGSRILITSRSHEVALKAKAYTDPHPLRLLSDAESWVLLQMKIFRGDFCPKELMECGKQIAKSCKGLPLAIVAMAGLLERIDRQQNQWKEIAENLTLRVLDDPLKQCLEILELSLKNLPDFLKACFLYFGAFMEDEDIPVQKLIRLWIAEGFVQETELKSLEDIAEDYLMDLISRSLVLFAQRRSNGGVKSCRIHDMLRNLCLSKAKEENFLQLITSSKEPNFSFDGLDYGVDFDYRNCSNSMTYEDHRLCIYSKRKHFVLSKPSGPYVRSFLLFATNDMYPRCPYDISFIFHKFKFLKVLDLECINMGTSFPSGVDLLVQLRYLAVSGDIDSIPSSIANLWNLETFLVKGLKGTVELPDTIWCMARLRHVRVSSHAVFCLQDEKLGNFPKLGNLVTLSSPVLCYGASTNNLLRQFPILRKLRCVFRESLDISQKYNQFPGLDLLTQLESLKISYYGRTLHPGEFNFPLNLKKLTLSNFHLPWNYISVIGRLQNLEVLKLLSRAFDGERWDMVEGEFSRLKFLKLDTLNITKWNASSDHLPNLQQLVLRCCNNLEEVPSSFVEIPTLQVIELQWCGDSAEQSVRKIREEGDEALKVFINLSDSNFRSTLTGFDLQ